MVPKERLMTALCKEKPDRLPVSVHQWQAFHLDNYLNGISALEAFQKFGMDAQIQYFGDDGQTALVECLVKSQSTKAVWPTSPWFCCAVHRSLQQVMTMMMMTMMTLGRI